MTVAPWASRADTIRSPSGSEYSRVSSTCPRQVGAYSTTGSATSAIGPAAGRTLLDLRPADDLELVRRHVDAVGGVAAGWRPDRRAKIRSYIACVGL